MIENIFEYAVENRLRFNYKGSASVEDLYNLTTVELDSIYKALRREAKRNEEEESLLGKKSNEDIALYVKTEIVKRIVAKKLAQVEARDKALKDKQQKEKILAIIEQKEAEELHNKSIEDLKKMLD
jgi:hypothetical protein